MAEMFSTLGTWNWLIFGFILMALELLAPGVFMFWLGLAALLVGLLSFAINLSWQTQILMFAVFAVAAVPAWRHFARSASSRSVSNPFLNKRTEALIGREFTLKGRSSTGQARCGSTTRSGASPAPTRRPAAASRSCRLMAQA
jgi:membrane protein implicated in regulation of membrane protease activity